MSDHQKTWYPFFLLVWKERICSIDTLAFLFLNRKGNVDSADNDERTINGRQDQANKLRILLVRQILCYCYYYYCCYSNDKETSIPPQGKGRGVISLLLFPSSLHHPYRASTVMDRMWSYLCRRESQMKKTQVKSKCFLFLFISVLVVFKLGSVWCRWYPTEKKKGGERCMHSFVFVFVFGFPTKRR